MLLLVRIILIASMVLQSVPGLVERGCALMPGPSSAAAAVSPANGGGCGCCGQSDDQSAATCPLGPDRTGDRTGDRGARVPEGGNSVGCPCTASQPDEPRTPPSDRQKSGAIERLFAASAPVVAMLPAEPPALLPRWTAWEPPRRFGSHSIQSLLCVWVM